MSLPLPPAADGRRSAPGISDSLHEVLHAAAAYVAARWALLRIEAGCAGGQAARGALAAAGVVLCGLIGYLGLVIAAVAWTAARWCDGNIAVPTLIAAGLHLFAALILILWIRRLLGGRALFTATRQEFEEDYRWLIQHQK